MMILLTRAGKQRFLIGKELTAVDLRLVMTLLRWDVSYHKGFGLKANKGGVLLGDAYPNLRGYVRAA